MPCPHASDPTATSTRCALAGVRVAPRICDACRSQWPPAGPPTATSLTPTLTQILSSLPSTTPRPRDPDRGLGDTLARLFQAVGVRRKPGCGCGRRQSLLNRLVPYAKNKTD